MYSIGNELTLKCRCEPVYKEAPVRIYVLFSVHGVLYKRDNFCAGVLGYVCNINLRSTMDWFSVY